MAPTKELSSETITKIIGLKEAGHHRKEIRELVGVAKSTVQKWCDAIMDAIHRRLLLWL